MTDWLEVTSFEKDVAGSTSEVRGTLVRHYGLSEACGKYVIQTGDGWARCYSSNDYLIRKLNLLVESYPSTKIMIEVHDLCIIDAKPFLEYIDHVIEEPLNVKKTKTPNKENYFKIENFGIF